ncbi:MMPL family transporter [Blastococcus haudaquaticus]|uniref:Putative drug exporter of the RND superfamily n=1 Tax=Blastococcus haudaquaticus TaxID=1938745 RepID=A0A286GY45_9ACTN|nr:MMPL family transporter [Blastococcus haudaquaticus]SOE00450.1 putative drug exporter of the RND superfamily [Blastococcus haudaquaticus]
MQTSRNLAARMGRWSARHRKTAVFGWLAFVALAVLASVLVPQAQLEDGEELVGAPAQAQVILEENGWEDPASEMVLVQRADDVSDATATAALTDLVATLEDTPEVANVVSPLAGAPLVSADGRSALVTFDIRGSPDDADERIGAIQATVGEVADRHGDVRVEQFGGTSADLALDEALDSDFQQAELLSLPIILAVLMLTFGALVAAVLPLVFAITAFVAAFGLLSLTSQLWHVDGTTPTVMLLIGLAVGVDYSLFYLKREREERARGLSAADALEVAAATSGRSVLISGITVVVAMAGMFLTGFASFTAVGVGTILVVATSVLGSLTVLPALMSWLGDRVEKGRLPFIGRRRAAGPGRFWPTVLGVVLRRPLVAALVSAGLLVGLAVPAVGLSLRNNGITDLPGDLPVIQTYERIAEAFPGGSDPAQVVLEADDVTAPAVQAAIADLRRTALATGDMFEPIGVETNEAGTVAVVSVPLVGDGEEQASRDALAMLIDDVVPATVGQLDGVTAVVTGSTAWSVAFEELLAERTPWVFGFVLVLAFLLLLVSFRSVVVAVTAIVLNLLSVAAAYGAMVLVFQEGWGADLIGLESTGPIVNWIPLFLFVILFGLSMDYHVFILSRIREARDRGLSTREAIASGITSSAGVVTSAAMIMVFVFLCFVGLSMTSMKQIGLGLALAVLLDATLVRAVLLPAVMRLLGEANWYLPRWLDWLPTMSHDVGPDRPAAVVPAQGGRRAGDDVPQLVATD